MGGEFITLQDLKISGASKIAIALRSTSREITTQPIAAETSCACFTVLCSTHIRANPDGAICVLHGAWAKDSEYHYFVVPTLDGSKYQQVHDHTMKSGNTASHRSLAGRAYMYMYKIKHSFPTAGGAHAAASWQHLQSLPSQRQTHMQNTAHVQLRCHAPHAHTCASPRAPSQSTLLLTQAVLRSPVAVETGLN